MAGSAAEFKKVELEWLAEAARLAKQGSCRHFSLLTSAGANANLWACDWAHGLLYLKVKGQVRSTA